MHEINFIDGKAQMMYVGEHAWHGLGHRLGDNPVTYEEVVAAVPALNTTYSKRPVYGSYDYVDDEGASRTKLIEVPNRALVVRDLDQKPIDVVGSKYEILQPGECFDFVDVMAGAENLVSYHTAGALRGGRIVWLAAELTSLTFAPVPGDEVQSYLVLVNGYDGSTPLLAMETTVRPVCANTVRAGLAEAKKRGKIISIRHTKNMRDKAEEARRVLGLATERIGTYIECMQYLAKKRINAAQQQDILDALFPVPEDEGRGRTIAMNKQTAVRNLSVSGLGTDIVGVKGTAWGLYNAVTEYTTHHMAVRTGVKKEAKDYDLKRRERLLDSSLFGTGDAINQKTLKLLVDA